MKLLLDSHTFIWFYIERQKLSPRTLSEMLSLSNELYLSLASIWELQIKILNEKLTFNESLSDIITAQQIRNGVQLLSIELPHLLELENLPLHHKDPFDRLLISQAIVEDMTLISSDKHFADYDVKLLW